MYNGLKNFLFERSVILTRVSINPTKGRGKSVKTVEGFLKVYGLLFPLFAKNIQYVRWEILYRKDLFLIFCLSAMYK